MKVLVHPLFPSLILSLYMGDQAENQDGKNGSDEPDCSAEPAHIQNSFYARPQLSLVPLRHTKVSCR